MPSFTQAELNTEVTSAVTGDFEAADFLTVANRAVRTVMSDLDLRSSKRNAALSPNLFNDVYKYSAPSDLKGMKIIDIQPQLNNRGRQDYWTLVTEEEFSRYKNDRRLDDIGDQIKINSYNVNNDGGLIALASDDLVKKLLLSKSIDDSEVVIGAMDVLGDWTLFGDGENLTRDPDNYMKGSASINWDISSAGGTTAGIYNDSLTTFDISDYKTNGSIFVHAYISSATNLTNFIIRIGSSASAYHTITITTNNEGTAFYAGWNLLRFDFTNKTETGTVDDDGCDYVALYMTKDGAKISETDYRFDNIVMKLGDHFNVIYYSKYPWQSNAAVYLEDATAVTDVLNCDTDEYNLIITKTAQLMEQHLKNHKEAAIHKADYIEMKDKYEEDNPSEALLLSQTYWDFNDN